MQGNKSSSSCLVLYAVTSIEWDKKHKYRLPSFSYLLFNFNRQYPEGHTSKSIYVVFKMIELSDNFPESLKPLLPSMGVAIWTTTPWTIPANAGK